MESVQDFVFFWDMQLLIDCCWTASLWYLHHKASLSQYQYDKRPCEYHDLHKKLHVFHLVGKLHPERQESQTMCNPKEESCFAPATNQLLLCCHRKPTARKPTIAAAWQKRKAMTTRSMHVCTATATKHSSYPNALCTNGSMQIKLRNPARHLVQEDEEHCSIGNIFLQTRS